MIKSFTIFAFCLIAFVQTLVECKPFTLADDGNKLSNLTILSGEFHPPKLALWRVLVYALESERRLKLPITSAELDGIVYLEYGTDFVYSNGTPAWENQSFLMPAHQYTDNDFLAVEVHGIETHNQRQVFYHGGIELTFGQLKQLLLGNKAQLLVFDEQGKYGVLNVEWHL